MQTIPRGRIRSVSVPLVLVAALLLAKLYFVQIVHGDSFAAQADRQYVRPDRALFERGSIFFEDKDGNRISAATVKTGFTLAVNPLRVEDADEAYRKLSRIVALDRADFLSRAAKEGDPYEEVAHRIDEEAAEAVSALDLSGVELFREKWRYYPGDSMAAHALGFVGFEGDALSGRYGVERYYDDVLESGGEELYVNFFAEAFAGIERTFRDPRAQEGDIVLSIEPAVQAALERELASVDSEWKSRGSGGIILDPQTGAIYAMAVTPDFNPNAFGDEESAAVFVNPLVENVFEMGSIIKPITVAAGLDAGVITADTTYEDTGSVEFDGATISNYDGRGRGLVDMQDVLNQSLNTGVSFIVDRLGNDRFREYVYTFGVAEETGVDLPGEVRGLVDNLESPRDLEYRTAAFGQGIALTPIGTVRALSALANGGDLITPHVVKGISNRLGVTRRIAFDPEPSVISPETADEITRMLVAAVDEALLNGEAKLPRYSVAAKTGTAQIASADGSGYYTDRFFHSFFGYFPAYDPEFLVFLYTREPRGVRFASRTLTEPFMDLTKFLLTYYEVPPDR